MFSQDIALALFIGYPQQTQPLILQDLRSADPEAISRGIYVAGHKQASAFPDLFDDLKRISFSDGPCADEALQSLVSYSLNFRFPILGTSVVPSSRPASCAPVQCCPSPKGRLVQVSALLPATSVLIRSEPSQSP
jgi:hypothetical protein